MYYPCSENKVADQLHGYREADLRLCFRVCKCWFSRDVAHILSVNCLPTVNFLNFWMPENCCNQPKIQTKRPNHRVIHSENVNGRANSEDPDQTAPLGAV